VTRDYVKGGSQGSYFWRTVRWSQPCSFSSDVSFFWVWFFFYRNIYLFICLCHVSVVACRIFFDFGTWDLLLLLLSRFSCVRPHRRQPTKLPHPWESPGKNTGVGSHFLLQCMKVKSESEVARLYPTLSDPMDCSLPGSSVHGIFQARVLEWGAITFYFPGIYFPDWIWVPYIGSLES